MTKFEPVKIGLKWAVSYQRKGCAPNVTVVSFWLHKNAMQMCHVLAAAYEDALQRGAKGAAEMMIDLGYRLVDSK